MAKKTPSETEPQEAQAPKEPQKTGLALLQFEYADPKTGEPTALRWKAREVSDACGIVSKFGTLLHPDGTEARFTHAEAVEVRRYLVALRPNDEIQISNLQ